MKSLLTTAAIRITVSVGVLLSSAWRSANAQHGLQVQVNSGTATDQRGVRSTATSVAPILTLRDSPRAAVVLMGNATRFAANGHAYAGAATTRVRSSANRAFAVGFDADGGFTSTSFDARFTNAQVAPLMEWRHGPLLLAGGARAAYGSTSVVSESSSSPSGGLGGVIPTRPQRQRLSQSRTLWGPQAHASLLVPGWSASSGARLSFDYGQWNGTTASANPDSDVRLHDVTLGLTLVTGRVTARGAAGRRMQAQASDAAFASAQVEVALSRFVGVNAAGGRYLADPVSGTLGGRFFTVGMVMRFGGQRESVRSAPRVRGVAAPASGMTRISIRIPRATTVTIAGDWNGWQSQPAVKASDDVWYVDLALEPGEYRYAFRVDGRTWRVPDDAVTSDDGLGGKVAWLSVRASAR